MQLALEAILGQRSAHSLATGPVIADPTKNYNVTTCTSIKHHPTEMFVPFISPLLFTMTPALSSNVRKVPSFRRIAFRWRITTAGITKKESKHVEYNGSSFNWCKQTFLPEIRLSFLDCCHHHIAATSCRQSVESALDAMHRDDVQVLGS